MQSLAIIGGGLVGASLALALQDGARERGWRIHLIEPFEPGHEYQPSYDARSTALSYGTRMIYQRLGLWERIAERNKRNQPSLSHLTPREIFEKAIQERCPLGREQTPEDIGATALESMSDAAEVAPLLAYEDDDAGGLMTPDFLALHDHMSVEQAIEFVRRWARDLAPQDIFYLFVVNRDGFLRGGVSLAELVLARPYQQISLLMQPDRVYPLPASRSTRCEVLITARTSLEGVTPSRMHSAK